MLLERVSLDEGASRSIYTAAIYTPEELYHFDVELLMDGSANLTASDGENSGVLSPEEHTKNLLKLCKSIARAAKRKLAEGLPPWPPRILRWRGPGRG